MGRTKILPPWRPPAPSGAEQAHHADTPVRMLRPQAPLQPQRGAGRHVLLRRQDHRVGRRHRCGRGQDQHHGPVPLVLR